MHTEPGMDLELAAGTELEPVSYVPDVYDDHADVYGESIEDFGEPNPGLLAAAPPDLQQQQLAAVQQAFGQFLTERPHLRDPDELNHLSDVVSALAEQQGNVGLMLDVGFWADVDARLNAARAEVAEVRAITDSDRAHGLGGDVLNFGEGSVSAARAHDVVVRTARHLSRVGGPTQVTEADLVKQIVSSGDGLGAGVLDGLV